MRHYLRAAALFLLLTGCGVASKEAAAPASYPSGASPQAVSTGSTGGERLEAAEPEEDRAEAPSAAPADEPAPASMAPAPPPAPQRPAGLATPPEKKAEIAHAPEAAKRSDAASTGATGASSTGGPGSAADQARDGVAAAERRDLTMLVYTAQVTIAVYQVEPGLAAVEQLARDLGGYLSQRSDTSITIRVPQRRFDEAMRRVGLAGDVVHREVRAEDVTDQVVDLEARLKNARAMRQRLSDLLQRADVKNALEIEKELGRVTEEIERMEGQLKVLRDKIAFSTITVTFQARGPGAVRDVPQHLPFPWLQELGLPRLLSLHE